MMQEKTLTLNGAPFHYRETGNGKPVVLLHGFGEDGRIWREQFAELEGFRLLVPDLPGSGGSGLQADLTMEGMAAVVASWLTAIGVEAATIIGHSMGGYVALAFAEKYPDRLTALGLFHSTAFADSEEKKSTRRKGIAFVEQHGAAAFLKTLVPNLYAPATKEQHADWVESHLATVDQFSAEALIGYYQGMLRRPDRSAVLKGLRVPVLLVAGAHDTVIPEMESLKLAQLAPLSYIHVLKQSGHMGMIEERGETARLLQQFLQSIEIHTTAP